MGDRSSIEWTDATWNPVTGCSKISAGCKFCYAERITERWGQRFTEIHLHPDRLDQPLRWRQPRRIFVNSMSDLFHEDIPIDFLARVFNVMACGTVACGKRHQHDEECSTWPPHTFQILTKRAERMHRVLTEELPEHVGERWPGDAAISIALDVNWPLPNVVLGVSCEDQPRADKRIPWLLKTPAALRFVSLEPLLGMIELRNEWVSGQRLRTRGTDRPGGGTVCIPRIDWVIVGGESGGSPGRALVERFQSPFTGSIFYKPKPYALEWVSSLRDQCVAASVPFFFKAWGGPTAKSGGRFLDGRTWDEYPTVGRSRT